MVLCGVALVVVVVHGWVGCVGWVELHSVCCVSVDLGDCDWFRMGSHVFVLGGGAQWCRCECIEG